MKNTSTLSADLMAALFETIVEFMLRSGVSAVDLELFFRSAIAASSESRKRRALLPVGFDFSAAAAIKIWHNDPRYLTSDGRPKQLTMRGKIPSVEALAKKACPNGTWKALLPALKSSGILKRTSRSRYLPSDAYATPQGMHPIAIQHIAKSVVRLVETAMRNTSVGAKGVPLIERFARVPDLDTREARAFAEFTRRQGLAYLQSVDDWLETRRKAAKSKRPRKVNRNTTGAGVHLFAYIGDEVDDELIPDPGVPDEGSFRHLSWVVPSGSRRVAAPCTTSGAAA